MIVLMSADWFFSMNAGEDCESQIVEMFHEEEDYETYLEDEGITDKHFDKTLLHGEEPPDNQWTSWYYRLDYDE